MNPEGNKKLERPKTLSIDPNEEPITLKSSNNRSPPFYSPNTDPIYYVLPNRYNIVPPSGKNVSIKNDSKPTKLV